MRLILYNNEVIMLMKKVLGTVLVAVMQVWNCIGSESFSLDNDSSLSSFETKSKRDIVAQLPMLKKGYNVKLNKNVIGYCNDTIWIKSEEELEQKQKIAEEILKNMGNAIEDREILEEVMNAYNDLHYELNGAYLGLECAPYEDPEGFTRRMAGILTGLVGDKLGSIPDYSLYAE